MRNPPHENTNIGSLPLLATCHVCSIPPPQICLLPHLNCLALQEAPRGIPWLKKRVPLAQHCSG